MDNNSNLEKNSFGYYGLKIQDFDNRLCEMFSVASITKDGSESFDNISDGLMEGLETQIKILLGNEINAPFVFCLLNEKGGFIGTIGTTRGFSKKDYKEALNKNEEALLKNEYIPGKMFLPTYEPNQIPASTFLINRQWSAPSVLIYWNSTEDKEKFDKSFGDTIDKFVKSKEQIQFIGTYGSEDTVKKYMLNWGGIHSDIKQDSPCLNISNLFYSKQIDNNQTENIEIQKNFLKAIAFLLQQTFISSSDFRPSSASTSNECYIFFIPSVFDSNCRTGLLLFLLNPDKVLKISTKKSKKTVQNGITLDELYQKLLMITRAWGLATERQFLNHKNSRIQFQTIQEQADLFAEKVTSQTLEQYLEQAFQSKPEFRNRICFLDLHFCNQDERNSDDTNNIGVTITLTKDKNRLNQDISNQGEQILIQGFNNDNSLDIIKTIANDDSLNDSFKYWESHIDNSKDAGTWSTWSRYINTIKDHKDELKSYNNHEITHVVGIPFFDQDKKYIAGVLVGFASKNNDNRKEDDFNNNFIEWLHLIIRQLASAYIINTNRVIDQENSKFAIAAYRIGHPLKDRTGAIKNPLKSFFKWRMGKKQPPFEYDEKDDLFLNHIMRKALASTEILSGFGHMLDIIQRLITNKTSEEQFKLDEKQDVFLIKKEWNETNKYEIKSRINSIANDANEFKSSTQPLIDIETEDSLGNPVITPWISQIDGTSCRPFDMIYDEIFRETLLNARKYGVDELDDNKQRVIKIGVRQEIIKIDKISKNCLVFSNKSIDSEEKLGLTDQWKRPSGKNGGGLILLTTLLEITNSGNVNLRYINGNFEIAFYLNGMAND